MVSSDFFVIFVSAFIASVPKMIDQGIQVYNYALTINEMNIDITNIPPFMRTIGQGMIEQPSTLSYYQSLLSLSSFISNKYLIIFQIRMLSMIRMVIFA